MDAPFSDLLKESKIFADREVLSPHYVPHNLLYREKQIDEIVRSLTPSLKGERGRNLFVYGKTGTGKTSCMKKVIDQVREIPTVKARITYVNCRIYNSRYRVLGKIAADHLPNYAKRGFGIVDIYEKIINWIEEDGKVLLVVLDELDSVKDLDDLIYTLARANSDIRQGGITMVGISNKLSFKETLDPRSLSTLYENEVVFPPYNSNELAAIIKDRTDKGFKPGKIDQACINYAAAISAKESGDARLALKIISKAGEIADEKNLDKVTDKEIAEAQKTAEEDIAYEAVITLPQHQKLVLYAIALLAIQGGRYKRFMDNSDSYIFSGEAYSKYTSVSEAMKLDPKSTRWYRKYIADLEMQGFIATYESGKGIRGHTKLIKLTYPPEKIKDTIEKSMFAEELANTESKGSAKGAEKEKELNAANNDGVNGA